MLKRFLKNEDGATAIEYGLIAALIGVAIIGAVGAVGDQLDRHVQAFDELSGANSTRRPVTRHCKRAVASAAARLASFFPLPSAPPSQGGVFVVRQPLRAVNFS